LRAVGIDFGTTNCAVAVARDGAVEMARFGIDQTLETFRSVLYFDGAKSKGRKRPLAGPAAIHAYLARESAGRLIQSLKSFLSSALFRETWVGSERYSVEDLTASMALSLREEAERQFGNLGKRLVLGRPVKFVGGETKEADELAVARLEQAFRRAGFEEILFEFEPVGAAYFYESTLDHDERVVIADFGGGTSDFSLLRVGPGVRKRRRILSTAGLPMAGDAFDAKIVRHVVSPMLGLGSEYQSLGKKLPMPASVYLKLEKWHHLSFLKTADTIRMLRSLEVQAEEPAKIEALINLVENDAGYNLHRSVQRTKVELSGCERSEFAYEDPCVTIRQVVTRADFEDWIEPELSAVSDCVDRLLRDAKTQAEQIDRVFLTGGSSLVPAVRRIFEHRFGADRVQAGNEFTSVARGLALRSAAG
jgi:hypothetical chaperone protein